MLRTQRASLATAPTTPTSTYVPTGRTFAQIWDTSTTSARHALLSDALHAVIVHPAPARRWTPDRIELIWQGAGV